MSTKAWREANQDKLRAYRRKHYHGNKQPYIERANAQKGERREWARALKEGRECMYCGESFWACLEFHHRDEDQKLFALSEAIHRSLKTKTKILAEIVKCDVVCANCHRKVHYGGLSSTGKLSGSNPELVGSNPTSLAIFASEDEVDSLRSHKPG